MYNDFVLIGPKTDPARIKGTKDVAKALQAIKEKRVPFISRGDRSGTHLAELALWNKDAGVDIDKDKGAWYKSIGQGMDGRSIWPASPRATCCPTAALGFTSRTRMTCKF